MLRAGDRHIAASRWAALTVLMALAGCAPQAGRESRPPRTENVTLHFLSQSCFQGEIIPCG